MRPGLKERGEMEKDLRDVSAEELKMPPMQPKFLSVSTETPELVGECKSIFRSPLTC